MNYTNRLFMAAALAFSLGAVNSRGDVFTTCGVDLGAAGRTTTWAVFSLGQDSHTVKGDKKPPKDTKNDAKDDMSGSSKVIGNFAMAGSGNVHLSGNAMIQGSAFIDSSGQMIKDDKGRITGGVHQDPATDMLLDQGIMDAMNASTFAGNLATSPQFSNITQITLDGNKSMTITGDGCTVLSLKNFKLNGSSVLTLTGTTGTAFVINVSNEFKLTGSSKIVLAGGLTASDVLFNIKGTGSKVELSGSSQMTGILLAAKRDASLSGSSMVFGEVISNTLKLSGSAKVTQVTNSTNP